MRRDCYKYSRVLLAIMLLMSVVAVFADDIDYTDHGRIAETVMNANLTTTITGDYLFNGLSSPSGNNGGAINLNAVGLNPGNSTLTLEGNYKFTNNTTTGSGMTISGGAIYIAGNIVSILSNKNLSSNILFSGNSTVKTISGGGGAIFATGKIINVDLEVGDSGNISFLNNSGANYGGAMYTKSTDGAANVKLTAGDNSNVLFCKNATVIDALYGSGGGIHANGNTTADVNITAGEGGNITFYKNTASNQGDGGGIYTTSGTGTNIALTVGDSGHISFEKNTAATQGGGIFAFSSGGDTTIDIKAIGDNGSISFLKNSASKLGGGAIYAESYLNATNIALAAGNNSNITFSDNVADNPGGAIYADGGTSAAVSLSVGDEGKILFRGNKRSTTIANAIYFDTNSANATLALNIDVGIGGTATFYDPIAATANYDNRVQVNLNESSRNTDDAISNGFIIFDGKDYLNADGINRFYNMVNDTVLYNGALAIANNVTYGRTSKDSTLTINEGAVLLSVQDFDLGRVNNIINAEVTLNNSILAFQNKLPDTYHTLNVNSLAGSSDIYMSFNSDSGDTDVLDIAEGASGTHTVSSIGIGDGTLLRIEDVIKVGEGTQSNIFIGGGEVGVLYYYDLEQNDDSGNWDLVRTLSDTSKVTLGSFGSLSVGWFTQLSNLNKRLGQLHSADYNTHNEDVWIRSFGGQVDAKFSVPNNVRFKEYNYGFDFGGDWLTTDNETNKMIVGLYGGYMRADRSFKDVARSTGKTNTYYGGLYSTWIKDNGLYFDFVTKVQNFRTSFETNRDSAEFSNYGFGASLESGRPYGIGDGFFIEPRAQVAYLHLNSTKFNFKNSGDQVRVNDANIYRFLGGAKFGQLTSVGSDNKPFIWYVSADIEKQISAGGKVEGMDESYSSATDGIRSVFGLGIMYDDSDSSQLYINLESSFGEKYNRPWSFIGGYRKVF